MPIFISVICSLDKDRKMQKRKAFTLLEIVIVLLILGIAAAIATPQPAF